MRTQRSDYLSSKLTSHTQYIHNFMSSAQHNDNNRDDDVEEVNYIVYIYVQLFIRSAGRLLKTLAPLICWSAVGLISEIKIKCLFIDTCVIFP